MLSPVPRTAALPPRELAICRRLEAFRRDSRIPRTVFARTVGFVPERLATYESGRSPLRYDAFRAINDHFFVSPQWLVTGRGTRTLEGRFDDAPLRSRIDPRALLSEVYDAVLAAHFDALEEAVVESWLAPDGLVSQLGEFEAALEDPAARDRLPTYLLERMDEVLDSVRQAVRATLKARGKAGKAARETVARPDRRKARR